jgi:hypothetical protein
MTPHPASPDEVAALVQAFADLHDARAAHIGLVHIRESFQGVVAWEGDVEVFELTDHPTATHGYAWSHETDTGGRRYITVLKIPPVISPETAVRAVIANEARKQRAGL